MDRLVLRKPIMIDGKEVSELTYDAEEITPEMWAQAAGTATKRAAGITGPSMELDNVFHLYLGFYAIIAVNKRYALEDLERIRGRDLYAVASIGRNFTIGAVESNLEPYEEPSGATPEPTIPMLAASEENGD